jgi:peroxiredoxin
MRATMILKFWSVLIFVLCLFSPSCRNQKTQSEKGEAYFAKQGIDTEVNLPIGLEVGETAPDFDVVQGTSTVKLSEYLKQGPVLLMFYRGYWCPVCNRYMKNIEDSLQLVREKGVTTLAVSPELGEYVDKTQMQTGTSMKLISDTSYQIQDAYKVRFTTTSMYQVKIQVGLMKSISAANGGSNDLPVPATYLIDQNQKIIYRHFDYDYHNRATVKAILEAVAQTKGGL